MSHIRIKICCISSVEEAKLAIEYGADALRICFCNAERSRNN